MRLSVWGGFPQVRRELFKTTLDEQADIAMRLRAHLLQFMKAPTSMTPQPPAGTVPALPLIGV